MTGPRRPLAALLSLALITATTIVAVPACSGGGGIPPPIVVPTTATVHVEVSQEKDGAPVVGAAVRLDASGMLITNETGYAGFGNEPVGPRHIWVTSPGFHDYDSHIEITAPEIIVRAKMRAIVPDPEPDPDRAYDVQLPIRPDGRTGWRDANGPMPVLGASWFPAIYFAHTDRARAIETLDMFERHGVDLLRVFIGVGGWESFWAGREVVPVRMRQNTNNGGTKTFEPWPEWDDDFRWLLDECRRRNIALFLTAGDLQTFEGERAVYERAARVIAAGGYQDVVAFVDVNEGWQNTRAKDDDPNGFKAIVKPIADLGIPWATSSHSGFNTPTEGPEALRMMSVAVGAPCGTVHGTGGTTIMIRRAFNVRFEGWRSDVCGMQGEPRGPGRDVSAGAVDRPDWIALAAGISGMTGQAYVLHTSRGIRDLAPGEPNGDVPWSTFDEYFQRSRRLLDRLPRQTIAAWGHGGRCGSHAEAVMTSTRADCAFAEDKPGVTGEFHRADVVRYAGGQVTHTVMLYGGDQGNPRRAKAIVNFTGTAFDTNGAPVGDFDLKKGDTWQAPGAEAGYTLVGRVH
jgi:hypothetical protein